MDYPVETTSKTIETVHYIGGIDNVIDFAAETWNNWDVESMHWSMHVTFRDNRNKTQEGATAQNLALVKQIAFNTLKNEKIAGSVVE